MPEQRASGIWLSPTALAAPAAAVVLALLLCAGTAAAQPQQEAAPGITVPLTAVPGNAARGRAIVADRQVGLCLLCHSGPFAEVRQQGNLAPDLAGIGSRLTEAELRLRIVDSRRIQPHSLMPAYFRTEGLYRVGAAWQGQPLLQAQQVEDVVVFLVGLK